MKRLSSFVALLLICSTAGAGVPQNWQGLWAGHCSVIPAFSGISNFQGSLEIKSENSVISFRLTYDLGGPDQTQVRDYDLKPIDEAAGHYIVDEKNGFLLDSYIAGDSLYSSFIINGNLVSATYHFSGNHLSFWTPSFQAKALPATCLPGTSICTQSLPFLNAQVCEFDRQ